MNMNTIFSEAKVKHGIQQIESEFVSLLNHLRNMGTKDVIEIGAYSGGSTYCFREICDGEIISIDIDHKANLPDVTYIKGKSSEAIKEVRKALNKRKVDFIFIDGDHSYEGVKKDFEYYKGLVRKGGFIALHDIVDSDSHRFQGCEVSKFWQELKDDPNVKTSEIIEGLDWGGIGLVEVF